MAINMFEQRDNPWQIREDELPSSFRSAAQKSQSKGGKSNKNLFLISIGLVLSLLWITIQAYALNLDYTVAFNPQSLPKISLNKPIVVPSPIRYSLLKTQVPKEEPLPALTLSLPPPGIVTNMLPANFTPNVLPPELNNPPPLPIGPRFKLVGIAQGSDGSVATLKVEDEATDTKNQLQDVREGTTLLNEYLVTKITPEYVLIKDKKAGKTIRVE